MSLIKKIICCFIFLIVASPTLAFTDKGITSSKPKEIYDNSKNVKLHIGNGETGPTVLLRALSQDYLRIRNKDYGIACYRYPHQ